MTLITHQVTVQSGEKFFYNHFSRKKLNTWGNLYLPNVESKSASLKCHPRKPQSIDITLKHVADSKTFLKLITAPNAIISLHSWWSACIPLTLKTYLSFLGGFPFCKIWEHKKEWDFKKENKCPVLTAELPLVSHVNTVNYRNVLYKFN